MCEGMSRQNGCALGLSRLLHLPFVNTTTLITSVLLRIPLDYTMPFFGIWVAVRRALGWLMDYIFVPFENMVRWFFCTLSRH